MFYDPDTLREKYNKEQFSNRTTKRIAIQNMLHQGKTCKTYLFMSENMMQETQEKRDININIPLSQLCMHSTLNGNHFRVSFQNNLFLSVMVAVQWRCQKQSYLTSFFLSLPLSVQMTPARMSPSPQTSCTLGPGLVLQLSTSELPLPTSHSRCYDTAAHAAATRTSAMHACCYLGQWKRSAAQARHLKPQLLLRMVEDRLYCSCGGSLWVLQNTPALQEGDRGACCIGLAAAVAKDSSAQPLPHPLTPSPCFASISTRMGVHAQPRVLAICVHRSNLQLRDKQPVH